MDKYEAKHTCRGGGGKTKLRSKCNRFSLKGFARISKVNLFPFAKLWLKKNKLNEGNFPDFPFREEIKQNSLKQSGKKVSERKEKRNLKKESEK